MHAGLDVSSFYLGNEDIARRVKDLVEAGVLDELLAALGEAGLRLRIESVRESEGLRELIGVLGAPPRRLKGPLPMYTPELDALVGPAGAWDPGSTLATRSRFEVLRRDGRLEEVYMPDHICPECLNAIGNVIESCQRVCVECDFRW